MFSQSKEPFFCVGVSLAFRTFPLLYFYQNRNLLLGFESLCSALVPPPPPSPPTLFSPAILKVAFTRLLFSP